ncbi:MAG: hypothetical protein B7Z82_06835 [Halothiobacillus sp. 20-54-6]|nr:MAG: hypothetical protein B7Z82_06835 [Halothiobacillus sp. 20-54-6]
MIPPRSFRQQMRIAVLTTSILLLAGCASSSNFNRWGKNIPPQGATTPVRAGDTLYSIAVAHDLDWRNLARWNGISDPRTLRAGQRLRLTPPVGQESQASVPRIQSTQSEVVIPQHLVAPRDQAAGNKQAIQPSMASTPPQKSQPASEGSLSWQWPVQGKVLSRFIDDNNLQKGLILGGPIGDPVRASAAGEVVYAGNGLPGYGNLLIIKHNSEWLSAYGYNQSLLVKEGQMVTAGQTVATMGRRDGKALDKTGSLLFQIRRYGKPVDPTPLLPAR